MPRAAAAATRAVQINYDSRQWCSAAAIMELLSELAVLLPKTMVRMLIVDGVNQCGIGEVVYWPRDADLPCLYHVILWRPQIRTRDVYNPNLEL